MPFSIESDEAAKKAIQVPLDSDRAKCVEDIWEWPTGEEIVGYP